ncbi:MAG: nitronate monooxygenase [Rhodospirillaceae bacterium]|nr:nitronate monooxygenase [Rhodospirillaceae bacterium]MBT5374015.1 nitronate monooxygenase [Rhodospirillaceae bacterium]MBT5659595.1 nitronate monooxygenase [Rhodospirillaceae bacterium]MBT5751155.1 nitronate monooxygenase [Rhodospirillaceae bacterium]
MKSLNPLLFGGVEVLPLIEGGKGVAVTNGASSGAWAASGGVGTISAVNADAFDDEGRLIPQIYHAKNRRERHLELIEYAVRGAIYQTQIAHEVAGGQGRLHINVLWEMGGAEEILEKVMEGTKGLIHGVTCGAGMPYRLAEICARFGVHYYPIISSGRAFRALWKRAYHKFSEFLGAVVYEDPWRAGGHNGLSNVEDPLVPEDPYPRVKALRDIMNEAGLHDTPIIMAGGVWFIREWENWIDNPELGPIAFQFGTRPLLTEESPIPEGWKQRLLTLKEDDISLHRFSPTGFYSSAIDNRFLKDLKARDARQVAFTQELLGEHDAPFDIGGGNRPVFLTAADKGRAMKWVDEGYTTALRTPDQTLIFVTPESEREIHQDQVDCMGCLSSCRFSNWAQQAPWNNGKKADPRSFCIQKTLQNIAHGADVDGELMFAGHNAYRFAEDPFYSNGYIPTVNQLFERILTGD